MGTGWAGTMNGASESMGSQSGHASPCRLLRKMSYVEMFRVECSWLGSLWQAARRDGARPRRAPARGRGPDHWHDDDADSSGLGASGSSSTPSRKNGGSKPKEGCHARAMQPRPTKPGLIGFGPSPSLLVGLQWSRRSGRAGRSSCRRATPRALGRPGWPLTCHGRATRPGPALQPELSDLTDLRLRARTKAPVANLN
jgi:hypothetical protein